MKTLVVYYSRKGSNKFLAEKIAFDLSCEIEAIRPRINAFTLFLMNINPGIRPLRHKVEDYERIILVGPIWVGRFVAPLKGFVKKYRKKIRQLVFVTCCGSTYEKKDEKFGHGLVFQEVKSLLNGKLALSQAFPIVLVMPEDRKEDPNAVMSEHLSESNFKGEIASRYKDFLSELAP